MDNPSYKELNELNRKNKMKRKHRIDYTHSTNQCYCHSRGTRKVRRLNRVLLNKYDENKDNWLYKTYNSHWTFRNNHKGCPDVCRLHVPQLYAFYS